MGRRGAEGAWAEAAGLLVKLADDNDERSSRGSSMSTVDRSTLGMSCCWRPLCGFKVSLPTSEEDAWKNVGWWQ